MSKLKELEKRLRDEPDNLGLRVTLAGALREAGRLGDAVELYRSVAIAYREQGRLQQAITVCRSVLEIAPDDGSCTALLATMLAPRPAAREAPPSEPIPAPPSRPTPPRLPPPPSTPPPSTPPGGGDRAAPARSSSGDLTPLPLALPYHVADPTITSVQRLSRSQLPPSLVAELDSYPDLSGIANAARQISESLIAASRRRDAAPREHDDDDVIIDVIGDGLGDGLGDDVDDDDPTLLPASRAPHAGPGDDDVTLPVEARAIPRARMRMIDDDKTLPRELPGRVQRSPAAPPGPAAAAPASAFLAPVPSDSRAAVQQRLRRASAPAGAKLIRRGEIGHGLVIVMHGRLEVHAPRADGVVVSLESIMPGEYAGEISLLARAPAAADLVAAVTSEIWLLEAVDFYEIAGAFPALWAELKTVAERRTRAYDQIRAG
jgi:Cyclic nucleotide-binding domain